MLNKKEVFGALALAIALTGCDGTPVPLTQVQVIKDSPDISGVISITTPDKRMGQGQDIQVRPDQDTTAVTIPETYSNRINVTLTYQNAGNLPSDAQPRFATITTTIKLDGDKKGGKIEAKLDQGTVRLDGADDLEKYDCNGLFSVEGASKKLTIRFMGFKNMISCGANLLAKADPAEIGVRDVSAGKDDYTEADDKEMGDEYAADFMAQNGGAMLPDDSPVTQYAQRLMDDIAANSDRPDIKPVVHVINANVLNAFALPGGQVFVFRGLLDASQSESQVVGVLGHEWAHVCARHGTKNLTQARSTLKKMLIGALVGIGIDLYGQVKDNTILQLVGDLTTRMSVYGGELYLLQVSRKNEAEADKLGSQYAWRAEFEPWGLADIFSVLYAAHPDSRADEMFSDHPALQNRIRDVMNLSALFYPVKPRYVHSTSAYDDMKKTLSFIPVPSEQTSVSIGNAFAENITAHVNAEMGKYALRNKKIIVGAAVAAQIAGAIIHHGTDDQSGSGGGGSGAQQ